MENLEMSGNLTAAVSLSVECQEETGQKSGKCQGKFYQGKLFTLNVTFGATPVCSRMLQAALYRLAVLRIL